MALTYAFTLGSVQSDGRRYVTEVFSDAQGEVQRVNYLAPASADHDAIATARALVLEESLKGQEVVLAVEVDVAPVPRFQTGAQFLTRLREIYRGSNRETCCRIARWLMHRLDAGDVTEAQLMNVFNLTQAQWDTLEAKMRVLTGNIEGVDGAAGE